MERKIEDNDRQIPEPRQVIDREAGERRRLNEVLTRLQETATREVKEKEAALKTLEATLGSFKAKVETLQKRVNDLEQLRRSDLDVQAARLRNAQALRARLEEAGHFASDLDHNMDGVDSLLSGLRERMRRLKETLTAPAESEPVASAAFASTLVPAAEAEPAAAPALSQAGFEFAATAPPPAKVEEELEEVARPEGDLELVSEVKAKVEPPSEVMIPAMRHPGAAAEISNDLSTEVSAEEESVTSVAEATPPPAPHDVESEEASEDVVPLISQPDEEEAPVPPPSKPEPPAKKDAPPPRSRFSWKRK